MADAALEMRRAPLRAQITKLSGSINTLVAGTPVSVGELRAHLERLEDKLRRIEQFDEAVLTSMEDGDPQAFAEEAQKIEDYRDLALTARALVNTAIENASLASLQNGSTTSQNEGHAERQVNASPTAAGVGTAFKVPEFKLDVFDGRDYLAFPAWYDRYCSLIHEHPQLTAAQKFGILKNSVAGPANQLIGSLLTTAENYELGLQLLRDTYYDCNLLLGLFVGRLHTLPSVKNVKSPELSSLVYGFEQTNMEIRNLIRRIQFQEKECVSTVVTSTQRDPAEMGIVSFFLTPHLLSKLPDEISMKWYDKTSNPKERYDFEAMMEFLKQDLRSRETCKLLSETRSDSAGKTAYLPNRARSATSALFNNAEPEGNRGCPVCQRERHSLWKCSQFMSMNQAQRFAAVKIHGFCFNCLSD